MTATTEPNRTRLRVADTLPADRRQKMFGLLLPRHTVSVLVADSTKFGRQSYVRVSSVSEFDHIVTDDRISDDWSKRIKEIGVSLHLATAR